MVPNNAYTPEWIHTQRRLLGGCDPQILEKTVHALALLGHLAESGLPFLFKGGTSLLLHVAQARRLSVDIDIVCSADSSDIDGVVAAVGRQPPFLRAEEDTRGERGLPRRRHFRFYFHSALGARPELPILLDVVVEPRRVHDTIRRPILTGFLEPEREVLVNVPTVESLLGDKLTAFAPMTVGVPLRRADGTVGDVMQIAKQLFDVGVLFEHVVDFPQVARVYSAMQAIEAEYRGTKPDRDAALNDTIHSCLALTASRKKILAHYPNAPLLHDGFRRLRGHLTWDGFGEHDVRRLAARAALLAQCIRRDRTIDLAGIRYTGSPAQLAALQAASFNGTDYAWLDHLKGPNPEAYHYWYHAYRPSGSS
jgi:hypothetical protein